MRELVENAFLDEVKGWLPKPKPTGKNWQALGLNGKRWGSIRVVTPDGLVLLRLKLHRDGSYKISCHVLRPPIGGRGRLQEVDGPVWDLRDPESVPGVEAWVKAKVKAWSR